MCYKVIQSLFRKTPEDRLTHSIATKKTIRSLVLVWCVSLALVLPIYFPFLSFQFPWLFERVVSTSLDAPNYSDGFQAWWTFLTTMDLLTTNGWILLCGLAWILVIYVKKLFAQRRAFLLLAWIVWSVRVFWQWFFFQRMMGYADVFWISAAAIFLGRLWSLRYWLGKIFVVVVILWHTRSYLSWADKLWRPIIEVSEFDFIRLIPSITTNNAVIVVPQTMYSPRVIWWSWRDVIAPWGFSLDKRWTVETWRTEYRRSQDTAWKCTSLEQYADLWPLYVWEWSKTVALVWDLIRSDLEPWYCFELVDSWKKPDRELWKVNL